MITIYTDGSCWPNPSENGGWGFVAYLDGEEFYASSGKAEGHTTNNRMEMTGMLRALECCATDQARSIATANTSSTE